MATFQNQRRTNRSRILGDIMYSRMEGGNFYKARVCDCTNEGIGFISDHPYLRDTRIYLKSRDKKDTSRQSAVIMWSTLNYPAKKDHPLYRIGARFDN